jgi:RNA polymerase sigma factor (TIGR02999 family)
MADIVQDTARGHATDPDAVARLIAAAREGDSEAHDRLLPLVYEELRRVARAYLKRERPGQTLQPTALVHDAWLRLMGTREWSPRDRAHLIGIAAHTMRRILVERARARRALKRGGDVQRVTLHDDAIAAAGTPLDVESLDAALTRLAESHPDLAQLVELRFFGGLSIEATAEALDTSPSTVKRRWTVARAWLARELESGSRT